MFDENTTLKSKDQKLNEIVSLLSIVTFADAVKLKQTAPADISNELIVE